MVNSGLVNSKPPCFIRPEFCEYFVALGRFPRFKNPVKYSRNFQINQNFRRQTCGTRNKHNANQYVRPA